MTAAGHRVVGSKGHQGEFPGEPVSGAFAAVVAPAQPVAQQRGGPAVELLVGGENSDRFRFVQDAVQRAEPVIGQGDLDGGVGLQVAVPVGGMFGPGADDDLAGCRGLADDLQHALGVVPGEATEVGQPQKPMISQPPAGPPEKPDGRAQQWAENGAGPRWVQAVRTSYFGCGACSGADVGGEGDGSSAVLTSGISWCCGNAH